LLSRISHALLLGKIKRAARLPVKVDLAALSAAYNLVVSGARAPMPILARASQLYNSQGRAAPMGALS
jgi:hypothetical protein